MTNLTNLELEVLRALVDNDFMDGCTGADMVGKELWSDCIYQNTSIVTNVQLPGVVSSLVKKGLVKCAGSGRNSTLWLTAEGVAAWEATGLPAR
jgi:hypothetical protein